MSTDLLRIAAHGAREQRRSLIGWAIALPMVTLLYTSFYPTYKDSPALSDAKDQLPSGFRDAFSITDFTSGPGYLQATVYGIIVPTLMIVFAVFAGARAVAGEEEDGTLDLYLAHPVSRRRWILERYAQLVLSLAGLGTVVLAAVALSNQAFDMGVSLGGIVAATVTMVLLALGFGSIAFATGAATGRRGTALAAGAVGTVAAYLFNALAPQADVLEWLRFASPYYWFSSPEPLRNGIDWGWCAALVAFPTALMLVGLVSFGRRDLDV